MHRVFTLSDEINVQDGLPTLPRFGLKSADKNLAHQGTEKRTGIPKK